MPTPNFDINTAALVLVDITKGMLNLPIFGNEVFVTDVMRALTAEGHAHCLKYTFPMIGQVKTSKDVLASIAAG